MLKVTRLAPRHLYVKIDVLLYYCRLDENFRIGTVTENNESVVYV